jgi:RNA recognition motif-containing protein
MRDKITGKTRGFGYVTLKNSLVIENILRNKNIIIDGKKVECKIAIPKDHLNKNTLTDLIEMINEGNINKINNARLNVEKSKVIYPNKIFVGGLPLLINEGK